MAKKKKRKDETGKVKFSTELTGLILLLISVIGIGSFGPVGHLIKSFAIFVMGTWWAVLIVVLLILGLYMILNRKLPKFFSSRLTGLYILLLAILAASHIEYITNEPNLPLGVMLQNTINNFLNTVNDAGFFNLTQMGGGIIGALFGWIFVYLFDVKGTIIVLVVFSIFGLVMLFDVSFIYVFNKIKSIFKNIKESIKESRLVKEKKDTDLTEKVLVSDVDDSKIKEEKEDEVIEEVMQPQVKGEYKLPPLHILKHTKKVGKINSTEFLTSNKVALERVLNDFQINGKVVEIHEGPAVTQYEIEIQAATKLNRITSIHKEIALALAAKDVRIEAPIPGKSTVGIEIPNKKIAPVPIRDVISTLTKQMLNTKVPLALGKDLMGRNHYADLYDMPHLLVAGSTGSGKSVCINSFIASILMFKKPNEVKLVLVDPKKVELSNYNGIPHLLTPVVTDPKKANLVLQKIVAEMDQRYSLFEEKGAKNISSYNDMLIKENKKSDDKQELLPSIVIIIDELADLMLVAAKEVEDSIMRITQMARAAGIHLIVATQRPSTDIITGVVKANIPSRIAFTVASYIDSRTILDSPGAEKLLGKGDMLYLPMGQNHPLRIQGTFISDSEISRLIEYCSKQQEATYDDEFTNLEVESSSLSSSGFNEEYEDPIYNEVVEFAIENGKLSASLLQRRFRVGYNRAARIMDLLEERGIIGPPNGSKPREVLVDTSEE